MDPPGAARAQNTAADPSARVGDAMTYCSADIPDQGRIAACPRQDRARISSSRQAAIGGAPGEGRRAKRERRRANS